MSTGSSLTAAALGGVAIGAGTTYPFTAEPSGFDVINSAPVVRLAFSDGGRHLGPSTLDVREIVFEIRVRGDSETEIQNEMSALKAAWGPVRSGTVMLNVTLAGVVFALMGRPLSATPDMSDQRFGTARARLVFQATDPRLYTASLSSIVLGLTAGGGMTFPLTFPLTFGAGSDSDGSAMNSGNTEAPWTATIVGPVTTPRLTLGATGEFIELDGVVPAGSTLVVDSATQSILLDGSPRQSWQTLLSRWWMLAPGANTIRYRAASGTGSCTFSWRSAWL